jgi:carbonic anhydrase
LAALESHNNWQHFDRLQLAGGAKSLTQEGSPLLDQIDISLRLHNTKEIALTIHHACGAYGDVMPKDQTEALTFIEKELRTAADTVHNYLKTKGKQVPVKLYAVMFDGIYELA